MTDTTRIESSTILAREESVQYVRAISINLTLIDARPNTKIYVFFGNDEVTDLCAPDGEPIGTSVFTNSIGQANINLAIPSGRFPTGTYEILVTDTNDLVALSTNGSVFGSARGIFSSTGVIKFFQETQTTINQVTRVVEIVRPPPPPPPVNRVPVDAQPQPNLDPLAQSFFTFGVSGGIFLSSIDLFFQTKDSTLPVSIELRELVNGMPSSEPASNINFVSTIPPSLVSLSNDGSVPTKFEFNPPVYLRENAEFCFVVRSNSNQYNIFTSRMGEPSFENGFKIFENPYVGSLFKSENNITWIPEQFEDIKFVIRKAVFEPSGKIDFSAEVPPVIAYGNQFSTKMDSNVVRYTSAYEHGLESGSKLRVLSWIEGTYNGIPGSELNGTHDVTLVVDRNTVEFEVTTPATVTGTMNNTDGVVQVMVKNGGYGYSSGDTITFIGVGSGAAGTLNIINGVIKSVTMTNIGTGYIAAPSITINSSTGTGAELIAVTTPSFTVYSNKPMTTVAPNIRIYNFGASRTTNTIDTTIGNYEGGNLTTYAPGKQYSFDDFTTHLKLDQSSLIASSYNEEEWVGGKSAKISIEMRSDNPNVSPVIDLKATPELTAYYARINNQPNEDLNSTNTTGSVIGTTSLVGGSNYTIPPIVIISQPDYPWGIPATAVAVLEGGSVSLVSITEFGSGYTSTPIITITRAPGDIAGSGASVQAVLSSFNTELLPKAGLAKARYLTKKSTLKVVSKGVRLLTTISSVLGTSVDWYIRTSLSSTGAVHERNQWQRMISFANRGKSSSPEQALEYEFGLDDMEEFDTYDLKCVLLAQDPTKAPIVYDYRLIVLA